DQDSNGVPSWHAGPSCSAGRRSLSHEKTTIQTNGLPIAKERQIFLEEKMRSFSPAAYQLRLDFVLDRHTRGHPARVFIHQVKVSLSQESSPVSMPQPSRDRWNVHT